jgi:hypothetical protein
MSKPIEKKTAATSLLAKGFRESDKAKPDHVYFDFFYLGIKTHIWTKVSHGSKSKEIPDPILLCMKRQLKLQSMKDIRRYLSCDMTEQEYIQFLRDTKVI